MNKMKKQGPPLTTMLKTCCTHTHTHAHMHACTHACTHAHGLRINIKQRYKSHRDTTGHVHNINDTNNTI